MHKPQGRNELLIDAAPERVWGILVDTGRVTDYMRAVKRVDAGHARESVGATRTCFVEMEGRSGEVVERCTALEPQRLLTFVMERDAFGFSRLFDDFGFSFVLEPRSGSRTLVRIEGFYRERNLLSRALNVLMMRRKLHRLRAGILSELKTVAEQRSVSAPARV